MSEDKDETYWREHIGEGWRPLFDALMIELRILKPDLHIAQVKQKFGELRVYLDSYPEGGLDLIDAATRQSKQTCEICGKPARLVSDDGFYQTLCEEHQGSAVAVDQSPIVASFRFGADGIKKVDR